MAVDKDFESESQGNERDIAVIGMAGRFPGARDLDEFWRNLRDGVEGITFFSDDELRRNGVPEELIRDPRYVKAGSLLDGVEDFDAEFFGYTAREAELLDPQQRLFLETCWSALENAGYEPGRHEGLVGIYAGVAWNTYLLSNLTTHQELFEGGGAFQVFITNDKDFMPTRVSYKLNLKGPSLILQTSCSTSLVATHLACLSLMNYECDTALVGGVTVKVPQEAGYFYMDGGLASPDGHCRAFDAAAAGTVFGSGVGVVALKRLAEAIEDGDPIRAVIRGSAINNDGSAKVSYTAPSVEGQAEVIAAAQAVAGIDPRTVTYVETHGTGTSLGDPIEVTALTKVFRESTDERGFCGLGSVKTNVGHLDAAAGVAGLIKTVLALEHEQLPPSLNFETPNPAADFESSPFYVNARLRPWEPAPSAPRRAGVSSFGVGGTNAHVVLEQAPPRAASGPSRQHQLLVLSARSPEALEPATDQLAAYLRQPDVPPLADVAYTLRQGRAVFRHRRALVCRDAEEGARILETRDPQRLLGGVDLEEPRRRPVVFLLSGQGSQYPGMGRRLYAEEAEFRRRVDEAAEPLQAGLGVDVRTLLFASPESPQAAEALTQTRIAQPALFVLEYALAKLWESWGVEPVAYLGHSIGEIVAACLAGVLSLPDALRLVVARGSLMQELPPGAMVAVPLSEADLEPWLEGELCLAAVNEPARCVVSGPTEAVAELVRRLEAEGVAARPLHTSHAFHSSMMDPILEPFRQVVSKLSLKAPQKPILSNLSGQWLSAEQAQDPEHWVQHLRRPVRFAASLEVALEDSERIFLEVGPGRTLATLAGRHPARQAQPVISSLRHPQDEDQPLDGALAAMARLWLAGLDLDPSLFFDGEKRHRLALPTYPFQRRRYWIEAGQRAVAAAGSGASYRLAEADAAAPAAKRPKIDDWFYLPAWSPSLAPSLAINPGSGEDLPRHWLVFEDEAGVAAAVTALLRGQGCEVISVRPGDGFAESPEGFILDPAQEADYGLLWAALEARSALPEVVFHAWSVGAAAGPGEAFDAAQNRGFFSLLALAKTLAPHPEGRRLLVVGDRMVAVGPEERVQPEKATVLGLLRVLPQELPQLTVKVLDVSLPQASLPDGAAPAWDGAAVAQRLLAELAAPADQEVVAWRGHRRYLPSFQPVPLPAPGPTALRPAGVYLLTGGLEGNGFAFAKVLAREAQAKLVFLEPEAAADASAPAAEALAAQRQGRIASLRELGAEVLVVEAELDRPGFEQAVAGARQRFGGLHGVLHTAGTQGQRTFRALRETGRPEAEWHFGTKARPLAALEEVLEALQSRGEGVDFCLLLSSLASVLGGLAYGAYAAANAFQEAFVAEHNRRSALPWLALGWDVLELEDEAEQITELRRDLAALAMNPAEGAAAFLRALSRTDQLLVSTVDLDARRALRQSRIEALRGAAQGEAAGTPRASHPRPQLPTAFVPPESELEKRLAAIWRSFLGFEAVGVEDNFFELGGDSFIAVQVASRLQDELGIEVPVAKLYQSLTVRSLARLLEGGDDQAAEERTARLEDRRQSMSRRRQFQAQRRGERD